MRKGRGNNPFYANQSSFFHAYTEFSVKETLDPAILMRETATS
jgi:hypothetical protein